MVCRLGGCLSVAEIPPTCQEPEGLELTITGATGPDQPTLLWISKEWCLLPPRLQ
ncbi:rCG45443 [Rattus norvegicus]|uniref:RCG45443 n=1 Tax=Rattus norvegicus TaxID=10116 RepID=A6JTE1_RAT|nr:rCG45443 [Rattus norvegicus]